MSTLISRNTIQLGPSASGADGYYVDHDIIVTRIVPTTGKELRQKKRISEYSGSTKVATIDSIWDPEFIPGAGDSYEVVPAYPDSRVSINPAMQTMDYITSDRYGRGLHPIKDLFLPSWLKSGRDCDATSDVTVEVTSGTPTAGQIYRYPASGNILWQGEVKSRNGNFVRFTKVIGKLTNKWNSWKSFEAGAIVYHNDQLYTASGAMPTAPSGAGLTSLVLTSTNGGPPLSLAVDGNPVRDKNAAGIRISGYSLYDADGVDYWRHIGWDEHSQRYATRHQTNLTIDTSQPLFDNTNNLLSHFGGILRYQGGKYHLEVEAGEGAIPNTTEEPRNITADHIIGRIRITDEGIRGSYNSLTVAYADPANKFEARNISFFNSDFLKADRNVPKKGNLSIPGITNYYNARLTADKYLVQSRYGLNININVEPRGVLLLAGTVFQIQHPKYNWISKTFRITDMTHNTDCTVDIVASEHDEKFHAISNVSKQPASGLASESINTKLPNPTNLLATGDEDGNETSGGIQLTWKNGVSASDTRVVTEVYASSSPELFIEANISAAGLFTTESAHGLVVGQTITVKTGEHGFTDNATYFVKSVPTVSTFTISVVKDDPVVFTPTQAVASYTIPFMTANIIGVVPIPENTFYDSFSETFTRDKVVRYYWVRHRVAQ